MPQISIPLTTTQNNKNLFAADRDHYRKAQLVKKQKTSDHGITGCPAPEV